MPRRQQFSLESWIHGDSFVVPQGFPLRGCHGSPSSEATSLRGGRFSIKRLISNGLRVTGLLPLLDLMLLIKRVSFAIPVEDGVALLVNIVVPTSNSVLGLGNIISG